MDRYDAYTEFGTPLINLPLRAALEMTLPHWGARETGISTTRAGDTCRFVLRLLSSAVVLTSNALVESPSGPPETPGSLVASTAHIYYNNGRYHPICSTSPKAFMKLPFSIWACLLLTTVDLAVAAQDPELAARVDAFVNAQMLQTGVPGMAVTVVRGDQVVLLKGYGSAGNGKAVTPKTTLT